MVRIVLDLFVKLKFIILVFFLLLVLNFVIWLIFMILVIRFIEIGVGLLFGNFFNLEMVF